MSNKNRSPESAARQNEAVHSVYMHDALREKVREYAANNSMSVSEVLRDAMRIYTTGELPPARSRRTHRVSFWSDPEEFRTFATAVRDDETTQAAAIEQALEGLL